MTAPSRGRKFDRTTTVRYRNPTEWAAVSAAAKRRNLGVGQFLRHTALTAAGLTDNPATGRTKRPPPIDRGTPLARLLFQCGKIITNLQTLKRVSPIALEELGQFEALRERLDQMARDPNTVPGLGFDIESIEAAIVELRAAGYDVRYLARDCSGRSLSMPQYEVDLVFKLLADARVATWRAVAFGNLIT
jgi:hypothetical protein